MACQTQKTNIIEQNGSATDVSIDIDHIEVRLKNHYALSLSTTARNFQKKWKGQFFMSTTTFAMLT